MRWTSWLPRSRPHRLCVVGLDIGPQACSWVVLSGSQSQPDRVCCAERLQLPHGLVAQGEVVQSVALGQWLRSQLDAGGYEPSEVFIGLDSAQVSHHMVTLAAGLSPADVRFQLQAEVQAVLPPHAPEVCIDYAVDTTTATMNESTYCVQAVPRAQVDALQRVAQTAGVKVRVIEPSQDAVRRKEQCQAEQCQALAGLPIASLALTMQCEVALGLALRAWHEDGINFLSRRDASQDVLRRRCFWGVALSALGGAVLAAGFAVVMASATQAKQAHLADAASSSRAWSQAQRAHAHAKTIDERRAAQASWLKVRQDLQLQSLQWSQVLSHGAQGVWVSTVKQQGTRWTMQGEALTPGHAQHLVQQLKALDIWVQAPELPQLTSAVSTTGLPVWQFRIEADLKGGM